MYVCKYLCLPSSGAWKIVKQIYFQNLKFFFFWFSKDSVHYPQKEQ